MTVRSTSFRCCAALFAVLALSGCLPGAPGVSEEEKEPHFLAGRSHVNQMDYKGAIECYEKAVQVNPQSASAHFELGWLFDQKEPDPAAAIYHYDHYLKLRPSADNAETVKTRILASKQELARTVSLGPVTQGLQHELDRLTEENKRLHEEVEKWRAYAASLSGSTNSTGEQPRPGTPRALTPTSGAANPGNQQAFQEPASGTTAFAGTRTRPASQPGSAAVASVAGSGHVAALSAAPSGRTHLVKPGETPSLIAKKYGVRIDALMAANPRLDARRMQVGQSLNIPQ